MTDGTVIAVQNDHVKEYSKAGIKVLRVKQRGDARIMRQCEQKAWDTYGNRVHNSVCVEARATASAGYGIGYEVLRIHRLYTENGRIAPFVRAG